jgi:hypothetical protein
MSVLPGDSLMILYIVGLFWLSSCLFDHLTRFPPGWTVDVASEASFFHD